jgi:hypothetical protein
MEKSMRRQITELPSSFCHIYTGVHSSSKANTALICRGIEQQLKTNIIVENFPFLAAEKEEEKSAFEAKISLDLKENEENREMRRLVAYFVDRIKKLPLNSKTLFIYEFNFGNPGSNLDYSEIIQKQIQTAFNSRAGEDKARYWIFLTGTGENESYKIIFNKMRMHRLYFSSNIICPDSNLM